MAEAMAKNPGVAHPDEIKEGDKIVIPKADEVLAERALPEQVVVPQNVIQTPQASPRSPVAQRTAPVRETPVRAQQSFSSGNTYSYGYCTYGVASWVRVPNNWGNANTWASRARAQGYTVNRSPSMGSVATTTAGGLGHVALVIGVDGSRVLVKEMNYKGWNVVSQRWTSASEFVYIHL